MSLFVKYVRKRLYIIDVSSYWQKILCIVSEPHAFLRSDRDLTSKIIALLFF